MEQDTLHLFLQISDVLIYLLIRDLQIKDGITKATDVPCDSYTKSYENFLNDVSLSTVVHNSRDCYENVWLPKICTLKQPFKNHCMKNQLQLYWYNTNNAITSFKVAKCC